LDYPKEKLQVIVIDSGSNDGTQDLVRKTDAFTPVELLTQEKRCGKASGINFALEHATGEIIIVTDADAYLNKNALRCLGRHFFDPKVGIVGGRIFTKQACHQAETDGTSFLRTFEDFLSEKESAVDSACNIGGELMAIRCNLAKVDEKSLAEDFDCLLNARSQGYSVIFDNDATAWEHAPTESSDVIVQKKRVIIGGIQSVLKYKRMILNPQFGFFGVAILPGHKISQLLNHLFFFLSVIFSVCFFIITSSSFMSVFLLALEIILLCIALYAFLANKPIFPFTYVKFFIELQSALVMAWCNYFSGKYSVNWEKINSKRLPEK